MDSSGRSQSFVALNFWDSALPGQKLDFHCGSWQVDQTVGAFLFSNPTGGLKSYLAKCVLAMTAALYRL